MDNTSESSSTRPWLWVIEALASCEKIDNSTFQVLIEVAPVVPSDVGKNTRELVARRCLEGLFGSAGGLNFDASSSLDSRLGFDVSSSCEDVLRQILHEVPLSSAEIAGEVSLKRDVYSFMTHKRDGSIKLELEQLKESVIESTHPCADRLKESSGLTLQNQDYSVPANDVKCNDVSERGNESNMEAKQNSSSKEHSHSKNFPPSKRNRDHSVDVHDIQYLHEKQVDVEECDGFLRSEKKNKCYPPSNIEFKNDKSCQTTFFLETKDDNEHHIVPIPASIDDPEKVKNKRSKSQSEQEIDTQQKEPNPAYPNRTWQLVFRDEVSVDSFNGLGAEHPEMTDFAAKRHELFSSCCISSHDFSANTEWRGQNLCMKCNEGGQLLVCKTTTCQLKVHESCLSKLAQFEGKADFLCPFCTYSSAVSEYLEAKKEVLVAREELCTFLGKGTENQEMDLLEVLRKENNNSIQDKCENILVKDNGNDQILGTGRKDNQEHLNEVSDLQFERSQQQAESPTPSDNILPFCEKEGIVNNGMDTVLNGEEMGKMSTEISSVEKVEESREAADHVTVGDGLFHHVPSVKQNTTGEENQKEMTEECSTDRSEEPVCAHYNEENVSEDGSEKHVNSRYSMRSRKYKTQCKPQLIPLLRKRKNVPWTAEEEAILMEGVQKFGMSDQQRIPWKQIWEFGSHVFLSDRRPADLKDKWKNICKAKRKLK
ncbi:uncharacterized protein LOC129303924 [Prosopis cineraria]|uniref:uncharacterized protein LOC129303924 n=1 Tax=Prosopis cineraria TaxID=364024 RepID=UPI00240FD4FC|nr:uncharacterized protein LOC129303924 [Prosopis cineraria]XP_054799486.1 uncharacterized protein LOC129303924 [Prosopis cineraria]XP_054799487.1 uncharacterized protein LOC129303924 [Prosopis cineraria]